MRDFVIIKSIQVKQITSTPRIISYKNASLKIIKKILYEDFALPNLFKIEDLLEGKNGYLSFETFDQNPIFHLELQRRDLDDIGIIFTFNNDIKMRCLSSVFDQYFKNLLKGEAEEE
jgi:hypothetical protein